MRRLPILFALLVCAGCGAATNSPVQLPPAGSVSTTSDPTQDGGAGAKPISQLDPTSTTAAAAATRRIIYEARVDLLVESLDTFERDLPARIREHHGYLADARTNRSPGLRPSGTWVVRVPVERFEAFLGAIGQGGFAQTLNQTSQEVTSEYVDLESRIANARRFEERMVKLLESTRAELQEVVTVERELARARGDLEQLEGRRRLLEHRTAMSTITIDVRERDPYVPPAPPEPRSFAERLAMVWSESWSNLRSVGETALLTVGALAPWLIVILGVALPVAWLASRALPGNRAAVASPFRDAANGSN